MLIKPVNTERKKKPWFSIYKICGESMSPEYKEGDFVVINEIPFFIRHLAENDIIIFYHPVFGILIKKIDYYLHGEGFFVSGIHENSLNSNKLGYIPMTAIRGKVIWHIRKL